MLNVDDARELCPKCGRAWLKTEDDEYCPNCEADDLEDGLDEDEDDAGLPEVSDE